MTQRNPMNDRYTSEKGAKGTTRKSAASAKPVTKAGYSVRVQKGGGSKKPAASKKDAAKIQKEKEKKGRALEKELARKYSNPGTPEYKAWRIIWAGMLVVAVGAITLCFFGMGRLPEAVTNTALVTSYICLLGSLLVDITRVRKLRKEYQRRMANEIAKDRAELVRQMRYEEKHADHIAKKKKQAEDAKAQEALEAQNGESGDRDVQFGRKESFSPIKQFTSFIKAKPIEISEESAAAAEAAAKEMDEQLEEAKKSMKIGKKRA